MVARNFEEGYAQLLQLAEDDREYLQLDQLKQEQVQLQQSAVQQHHVYYELNSAPESSCASMYLGPGAPVESTSTPAPAPAPGGGGETDAATVEMREPPPQVDSTRTIGRKRRSSYHDGSDLDDDTEDGKSCRTDDKKQNHSEIEKRRRDKMNTYITELAAIVPMCHAMARKLDKLTVLRMAVQHLKTVRGAVRSYTEGHYKPAFLSEQDLKRLILNVAEGFLFVVGCDRGRILFVSESVAQVLNFSQGDLLGQSWFDILHPKDVAKVKEQLSASDLSPRERLIDAKTMLPVRADMPALPAVSRLCPGARRSFFCRMKRKVPTQVKQEVEPPSGASSTGSHGSSIQQNRVGRKRHVTDRKYSVIQCTGYLKSWAPEKIGLEESELADVDREGDGACLSCLVAVGRLQPTPPTPTPPQTGKRTPLTRPLQFTSRHAVDGKFLFVDQRATLALGFLPQELLGTSMYEYYHPGDVPHLAHAHKAALNAPDRVTTEVYWFRNKEGTYVNLVSEWKAFKNPWTKDVEYLIAKNSVVTSGSGVRQVDGAPAISATPQAVDIFSQSQARDIQRIISSHVEASKIGRKIADEVLDIQRVRAEGDSPQSYQSSHSSPSQPEYTEAPGGSERSLHSPVSPSTEAVPCQLSATRVVPGATTASSQLDKQPKMKSPLAVSGQVQSPLERSSQASPSGTSSSIRNNVTLSSLASAEPGLDDDMMQMMAPIPASPVHCTPNDGNDEAAMAVIMSLLEADAGLGGPVDFSGLPWPLP